MTMGKKIWELRKAAGLSQEQLAECLEVSRQAVSKWETDQSMPETEKLAALCRVFHVSADELLGMEKGQALPADKAMDFCVKQNFYRRCFTVGWVTALVGAMGLVLEFLSLWFIRFCYIKVAMEGGMGFYTDVLKYAQMFPMPVVFAVTAVVGVTGVAAAVYGAVKVRGGEKAAKEAKTIDERGTVS